MVPNHFCKVRYCPFVITELRETSIIPFAPRSQLLKERSMKTKQYKMRSNKKQNVLVFFAFIVSLSVSNNSLADDQQRFENLENEIKLLKESQAKLEKQIADLSKQAKNGGGRPPAIRDLDKVVINTEADPVMGSEDAKLVMVEFSDYQCPFCKRHTTNVWPELKKQYVDTGKMKLVFHDFPLTRIHKEASLAAQAATCAGDQDKYWEMHDRLFEHPKAIKPVSGHAEFLGLEMVAFNECISSEKYADEVKQDTEQALELGIRSTPTFIFGVTDENGELVGKRLIRGAQPLEKFQEEIDKLLETAS